MAIFEFSKQIGDATIKAIQAEIVAQGHRLTGKLEASLEYQERSFNDGVVVSFLIERYGIPLDTGVSASRIPYSPGSGKKVSQYIQGLKRYAKLRFRVNDRQALSIAFAIANKHKKEGMPTRGSFKFSSTGRRTRYIEEAIKKIEPTIQRLFEEYFINNLIPQ